MESFTTQLTIGLLVAGAVSVAGWFTRAWLGKIPTLVRNWLCRHLCAAVESPEERLMERRRERVRDMHDVCVIRNKRTNPPKVETVICSLVAPHDLDVQAPMASDSRPYTIVFPAGTDVAVGDDVGIGATVFRVWDVADARQDEEIRVATALAIGLRSLEWELIVEPN